LIYGTKEGLQRCAGLGLTHERFADEEGVEAGFAQGLNVGGGMDAAFGDADGVGRELFGEFERSFEANFEGLEVAVVHAIGIAAQILDEVDLFGGMDFTKNVEAIPVGDHREVIQIAVAERGGDEEDGVGAMSAGFGDLILVDDEVFAKAGKFGGSGSDFKVVQAALEERLVGEDGERGGSGSFEIDGEGLRIEVGTDDALRGRGLF